MNRKNNHKKNNINDDNYITEVSEEAVNDFCDSMEKILSNRYSLLQKLDIALSDNNNSSQRRKSRPVTFGN